MTRVKTFALTIFVLILLTAANATAQGKSVIALQVEGNQRIESDAVLDRVLTRVGQPIDILALDKDLLAIWEMGFFYDVQVDVEQRDNGVVVTYVVVEKPSVKEFVYEGNRKLKDDKLNEVVTLRPNTILDEASIKENIAKIEKLYSDEGYFMADVEYRIEPLENNRVRVVLVVTEYRKVMIKKINFVGNSEFDDEELRKQIMSKENDLFSWATSTGIYREDMFENDIGLLTAYYLDNGYINVQIDPPLISLSPDRRWMYITVNIDEGEQYNIGKVDVDGDLLFEAEDLLEMVHSKPGEVFSRSVLIRDIEQLTSRYTDIGFAFADVEPKTKADEEQRKVDLVFVIRKGQLAYVERVKIVGNDSTRDKVIRRELRINEGDLFSGPAVRASKQRLMRLGYFEEVNIVTERGSSPDRVNLVISVTEQMAGNFLIGVGFSSLENFVGNAQVSHSNLLGYGLKVALTAELGKFRRNIDLKFVEPYLFDSRWIMRLTLLNSERDYYTFDRLDKSVSLRFGHPLGWDVNGYVGYAFEEVEIAKIANNASAFLMLQKGVTRTSSLLLSVERETVNNPYDPSRGSRNQLGMEYAGPTLGSEIEFLKYTGQTRWYVPVRWGIVMMFNAEAGYGQPLEGGRLPISQRYFLGGINSVRGFYSRSLGPEQKTVTASRSDDPATKLVEVTSNIGGNKYAQGNAELVFPIVPSLGIKGLLFYDIGNAFIEEEPIEYGQLRQAWGFGVRWFSPIGPLRFEWGFPLYPQPGEEKQNFEFGIGTFF
ncbi:MAG: outer membrane protein assembly factor BamA [Candidatus Alcyoniella australis]|nr:outer membrane protein assembly factor BamA [Candidatus Alcyoniella australis]